MKEKLKTFGIVLLAVMALTLSMPMAQITVPNVFTTSVPVSQLNSNFSTIGSGALNRNGGTITGDISVNNGVTIDNVDISDRLGTTGALDVSSLNLRSTSASALNVAGGINAGSGDVGIVDTTGKIPAISSAYFSSLSASNLLVGATALPTYVWNSGIYTPTLGGGGSSLGNGTLTGQWQKTGKTINVQIYFLVGSTTVLSAGGFTFSLPETAATATSFQYHGNALGLDAGTAFYAGFATVGSAGTTMQMTSTTAATPGQWTNIAPFTWGTSDSITVSITYQTAS